MAISFGRISCYLEYMSATLKAMFEAWDDLLFNLDSQLAGYSKVRGQTQSLFLFLCLSLFLCLFVCLF